MFAARSHRETPSPQLESEAPLLEAPWTELSVVLGVSQKCRSKVMKPLGDKDESQEAYHVYPTFGREHVTEGKDCWCQPRTEFFDGMPIIVHEVEQ
jgi:hypothetical protein